MPTLACALAGICGCDLLFPSFPLDRKGPKGQGRHHGPTALGNRPSPMSAGPARPTQSVFGIPILSERSSRVMPTRIGAVAGIYGCGRIQQPCHPHAGLCGGLGSMAAAPRNLPILLWKPDIAYRGVVGSSGNVMPTWACALAGIYGCGILVSARLNMKTRHCISGCGRVVLSGLCPHCRFASSRGTKRSIYDRFK